MWLPSGPLPGIDASDARLRVHTNSRNLIPGLHWTLDHLTHRSIGKIGMHNHNAQGRQAGASNRFAEVAPAAAGVEHEGARAAERQTERSSEGRRDSGRERQKGETNTDTGLERQRQRQRQREGRRGTDREATSKRRRLVRSRTVDWRRWAARETCGPRGRMRRRAGWTRSQRYPPMTAAQGRAG